MKKLLFPSIFLMLCFIDCKEVSKEKTEATKDIELNFAIEILDEEALEVIDRQVNIEVLAGGFEWTEGPIWIEEGDYLLFSDIPSNKVHKLDTNGNVSTYLNPSGYTEEDREKMQLGSNGLMLDTNGNLVLMQHGHRRIAKMNAPLDNPKEDYTTLVNTYQGKKLNSPNDGAFDQMGNLYFTDPPYGLLKGADDSSRELDFNGVYCLLTTGELMLLDSLSGPNGITLSPDESTLYVAVSVKEHAVWYQYKIVAPGTVADKKIFYDVTHLIGKEGQQGLPDGMKMHSSGCLFATGPGGVWVFDLTGKVLARIHTGQLTANCAFDTDEKKLFITADDYILSLDLK